MMNKTEQGKSEWEQVRDQEIDRACKNLRAYLELLSLTDPVVKPALGEPRKFGADLISNFLLKKNTIIYGFKSESEYMKEAKNFRLLHKITDQTHTGG